MSGIEKFKYLWTADNDEYVLVRYIDPYTGIINYAIYMVEYDSVLIIEDDVIGYQVIEEMLNHGVRVVDEPPKPQNKQD